MKGYLKREDDFQDRRKHLANLSDEELKTRFWQLAEKAVEPLLELAKKNTSPSIERSILLRMGFSSLEAKPLVQGAIDQGLIAKGVGHIVYRISKEKNIPLRQAGLEMIDGKHWDDAVAIFKGGVE
ncbi:ornithine aminomutase subunit alpha [Crassaminicella profunda]|uniref:ornithine aminomutase subunit alpha n=1 Tax=Crassaminicella profunda TaxID=1286698 RepID=UPI001CA6ABAA|nr:ornithine aminomutase subunit alpha [Crassaminicella profunda]QZY57035.1 ornithine aminomutase subunit alpha [Crassaminicella profunda]